MARKTVISKVLDEVPEDDVLVLPANRTLYADQFTDPAPTPDEERECFVPRSFADVFVHYQPCKKGIELITDDGKIVYEDFFFTCIEDFDDERLIAKSKVLACSRQHLKENLFNVREEIRELEIAYRTLSSFYDNVGKYADCVCLMNVDKAELGFYDSDDTCAVRQELESHYQCLDLRENYSLLVLPGYHGCGDIIRMWARVAYRNKVLMITDFKDCISFEDLKNSLDHADLQGADAYNSNVVMTVNYILGRKKSECADEGDDLYIPASGALAGRMANIDDIAISQACAGEEYGILTNVDSTRVDLSEMEIAELSDMGVIPITRKGCHVMACSECTLYNGANKVFGKYPTVRVFD